MPDIDAFSFEEFCDRHRICRATLYNLIKRSQGPAIMRVGSRVLISREAAADWRRKREAEAALETRGDGMTRVRGNKPAADGAVAGPVVDTAGRSGLRTAPNG